MEKVSIIIPIYNVHRYLPQCLDSILHQSYPNWEAILVNDGSTDTSGSICDAYAGRDPRFTVVHKENGGAASAKNTGLDYASGDYVAFIDSDDYVEATWLETLILTMQTHNADVVEFNFDKMYRSHCVNNDSFPDSFESFSAQSYLKQYLSVWTCSLFCNKLFRADLLTDIRFRRERRCIDDEFFTYKALTSAKKIVRIPTVLYHYRQRASSAVFSLKNRNQIADDSLEILPERYKWITTHFPELRKTYLWHDIQILFYFADFWHTNESAEKFRRISRYYFLQSLRYPCDLVMLRTALKLQFISQNRLLSAEIPQSAAVDAGDLFE